MEPFFCCFERECLAHGVRAGKTEWYHLVHRLDSFDLKCFACIWMDDLYLCSEEKYQREQCEEWAGRNGLDPGAWERIRAVRMAIDENGSRSLPVWNRGMRRMRCASI